MRRQDVQLTMEEISAVIEEVRKEAETFEEKNAISRVNMKLQVYAAKCASETFVVENGRIIG
jgi:hypothetical protein